MKRVAFLKLGGSLITDKSKPYTSRPAVIKQIVQEIKEVLQLRPDLHLVVGNGAGSFAHQSAKKYGTTDGFNNDAGKYGYCVVQNDAVILNRMIVEEFLKQGLPAVGFQPSATILSKNRVPFFQNFTALQAMIDQKIIPVVYGDAIVDVAIGATIFSTDRVIECLAKYFHKLPDLKVESILSIGNYDGVTDFNGQVIPEITKDNLSEISKYLYNCQHVDVTGGMAAKVLELLAIAKYGIKSIIVNGAIKNNLKKVLLGEPVLATVIQ